MAMGIDIPDATCSTPSAVAMRLLAAISAAVEALASPDLDLGRNTDALELFPGDLGRVTDA